MLKTEEVRAQADTTALLPVDYAELTRRLDQPIEAFRLLDGIPHTTAGGCATLYGHIVRNRYARTLELGFAHGKATVLMAMAAAQVPGFRITCVDMPWVRKRTPSLWDLIKGHPHASSIDPVLTPHGYNWYLRAAMRRRERFDFIFLDGAHTWEVDACATLLCKQLLNPGGMLVLDDLNWSIEQSPSQKKLDKSWMEPEYPKACHVRDVFELLLLSDPRFDCHEAHGRAFCTFRG